MSLWGEEDRQGITTRREEDRPDVREYPMWPRTPAPEDDGALRGVERDPVTPARPSATSVPEETFSFRGSYRVSRRRVQRVLQFDSPENRACGLSRPSNGPGQLEPSAASALASNS